MSDKNYLTIKDVMAKYGVTHMTVYLWRKGSAKRNPLPTVSAKKLERPTDVAFDPAVLEKWATKYGITASPAKTSTVEKRGPKVLAKPAAKKVVAKKAAPKAPATATKTAPRKPAVKARASVRPAVTNAVPA